MKNCLPLIAAFTALLTLAGCAPGPVSYSARQAEFGVESQKLGTAWGDDVRSAVKSVDATRKYASPDEVVMVSYSAQAPASGQKSYALTKGDIEFAVRDANFRSLPITTVFNRRSGEYEWHIAGQADQQYQLYFRNHSVNRDYEIVVTVDGLDVLNGQPGKLENNGYLLYAGKSMSIKGFRKNSQTEAAFTFSKPNASYAANSAFGDANNVGVIGFAVFEISKNENALPPCPTKAFPGDSQGYAAPPCRR